ncbi:hypothetical protein BMG03_04715 [Thioclava nitratireducens]|uniref:Polymerase n=2 Tax=Thioclava nitratireducens TaxID=1915078 RepID=A0ABM6IEH1_9RHOB|nr:hypothetical protein BMG03_04715 [Thioclava nitratireducens]
MKKNSFSLIILMSTLLILNGTPFSTVAFISAYLFVFSAVTSDRFISNSSKLSNFGFFLLLSISVLYSMGVGEYYSSSRFFPRLKGYTLEASYMGMTLVGLWFITKSSQLRAGIIFLICATQSGLAIIGLLMRFTVFRRSFILLFSTFTAYLIFTPINQELLLSNSFFIRFLGIVSVKNMDYFGFLFGRGVGASDAQVAMFLEPFGISGYSGSFIFGIFSDFGLLPFILLLTILTQRIPLALALLLMLNFALASPYTLFISWAWCFSEAKTAGLRDKNGRSFALSRRLTGGADQPPKTNGNGDRTTVGYVG